METLINIALYGSIGGVIGLSGWQLYNLFYSKKLKLTRKDNGKFVTVNRNNSTKEDHRKIFELME